MDAPLLPPRANAEPAIAALHGAAARDDTFPPPAPDERHAGRKNRNRRRKSICRTRWIAGIDQRAGVFRPERYLCVARRIVAPGNPVEPRCRAGHCLHHAASRTAAEKYAHHLVRIERNPWRRLPCPRTAADASPRLAHRSAAGI